MASGPGARRSIVVALALVGSGCDDVLFPPPHVEVPPYTTHFYDEDERCDSRPDVWLAWDVSFLADDAIALFESDNDCGSEDATPFCAVVDDAEASLLRPVGEEVCSPRHSERTDPSDVETFCSLCCQHTAWTSASVDCTQRCTRSGSADSPPVRCPFFR